AGVGDRLVGVPGDDVAGTQTGRGRRRTAEDLVESHSRAGQAEVIELFPGDIADIADAQPAADDTAVGDQVGDHRPGIIDRDGEPDADRHAGGRRDGGVDADSL